MKIDGLFKRAKFIAHLADISTVVSEVDVGEMQIAFASERLVFSQQMSVLYVVRYLHFLEKAQQFLHRVQTADVISHCKSRRCNAKGDKTRE